MSIVPYMQGQLILDTVINVSGGTVDWVWAPTAWAIISNAAGAGYKQMIYDYTPARNCTVEIKLNVLTSSATANQEFYLVLYELNTATSFGNTLNRNHTTPTVAETFYCIGELALTGGTAYQFQARILTMAAGNQTVFQAAFSTQMIIKAWANP